MIPEACEGIPSGILNPAENVGDPPAYEKRARDLARNFKANFKQFEGDVSKEVQKAMP
jgi:phosphoenolpyruvate carboxykinase (ATP)